MSVTLWLSLTRRRSLLVDLAILAVLGFIHTAAWLEVNIGDESRDPAQTAARIRETASGGVGVVGILIPLTIIAIQVRAAGPPDSTSGITTPVLIDLFAANLWLVFSLILGIYILYFSAFNGYHENILTHKHIGVLFGFQLFFLMVGVVRLVVGLSSLASRLLSTDGRRSRKEKP